jgi:hypothetical protein
MLTYRPNLGVAHPITKPLKNKLFKELLYENENF